MNYVLSNGFGLVITSMINVLMVKNMNIIDEHHSTFSNAIVSIKNVCKVNKSLIVNYWKKEFDILTNKAFY